MESAHIEAWKDFLITANKIFSKFSDKQSLLSTDNLKLDSTNLESIENEILRLAIIAEFDAINLYEQMASTTNNDKLKKILFDIVKEEKTHIGEFQALLMEFDPEYESELLQGQTEVEMKGSEENGITGTDISGQDVIRTE